MTRFHASGIHFLISLLIGAILLALCWFLWYPSPMLLAIGGHEIFLLVVGIDVVLGPLLTFVVFKSGKKSLKFDLAVIVVLQVLAMAYGVRALLEARPTYVAALGDHFQVIQATEVTDANLAKAKTTMSWLGPTLVGTKKPTDRFDVDAVDALVQFGGTRGHLPQLHIPYADMRAEILAKAKNTSILFKNNPTKSDHINAWLLEHHTDQLRAQFQPIKIGAYTYTIIIDATSAKVIGIIPFVLIH